ncbi:hypothetical protein [Pseudocolwellia agarivorans]|uniref:hypothetical protein n=1 Tax=Pseudocolwellia agarivorans TaxID=1911682 RepID=UPI0009846CF3|nr:hypothetical protein [Pseudocolwellia agarivorans]
MIKKFIPCVLLIGFTVFLASCSTQLRSVYLGNEVTPKVIPEKDFVPVKITVSVGDIMLTAGDNLKEPSGLQLESFHIKKNTITTVQHKMKTFEFSLPSGDYRLRNRSSEGSYYSAPSSLSGLSGTKKGYGGLFIPTGSTKATEFFWSWYPNSSKVYQAKLISPIIGENGESIAYLKTEKTSGIHITLTYVGVAGGQIKFVYKEFTEEWLARAAFTQEVSLDYKAGGIYAYKNAKFSVEKADSTHISFTLLEPF